MDHVGWFCLGMVISILVFLVLPNIQKSEVEVEVNPAKVKW